MLPLENELKSICQKLNSAGVEFMLIGGFAVSFHGFTRTTSDIDFWFNPATENYLKLGSMLFMVGRRMIQKAKLNIISTTGTITGKPLKRFWRSSFCIAHGLNRGLCKSTIFFVMV